MRVLKVFERTFQFGHKKGKSRKTESKLLKRMDLNPRIQFEINRKAAHLLK